MLTKSDPYLTEAKINEFKKEVERLKKIQPKAAMEVARLAELGDFSENVEYQLAKGRLRGINNNIFKLENQLNQAIVIKTQKNCEFVRLGHTVTVEVNGKQKTYQILGSADTDPKKGIISHNSPIGAALVNHKIGDSVFVSLNNKNIEYKIIRIE